MFRKWAEALAGHKASVREIDHIQRQLEAASSRPVNEVQQQRKDE